MAASGEGIRAISRREELPEVRARWRAALERVGCDVPFVDPAWYESALQVVDASRQPLCLFFEDGGADVAVAPLVVHRDRWLGLPRASIRFVSSSHTSFQLLPRSCAFDELLGRLIGYLRRSFGDSWELDLGDLRLTAEEESALSRLEEGGELLLRREDRPPGRRLELARTFDEAMASLKSDSRKELKRKAKRLSGLGAVALVEVKGRAAVEEHLQLLFALRAGTPKGRERHPGFYRLIGEEFGHQNRLWFRALTVGGTPVAYLLGVTGGDTVYGIKTTYDSSYTAFSPGVVLFLKCIEALHGQEGIRRFDLGRGDEQYKREWSMTPFPQTRLRLCPRTPAGLVRHRLLPSLRRLGPVSAAFEWAERRRERHVASERPRPPMLALPLEQAASTDGPASPLVVRPAEDADVDRLAVLMAARSLQDVRSRLAGQRCLLVLRSGVAVAYFWLEPGRAGSPRERALVREWGPWSPSPAAPDEDPRVRAVSTFLAAEGQSTPSVASP